MRRDASFSLTVPEGTASTRSALVRTGSKVDALIVVDEHSKICLWVDTRVRLDLVTLDVDSWRASAIASERSLKLC